MTRSPRSIPRFVRAEDVTPWAPSRAGRGDSKWEGSVSRKPWDFACEVAIPVLDTPDTIPYVIGLLRLQTRRPHIMLIDTGSTDENLRKIERFRAEDVEVHSFRFNGVRHPSDFPAIAMDFALSACRTEHLFCTHADVFLRRRDVIEELMDRCTQKNPAIGYQISPRAHEDWKEMISHTCTMLHIPTMDRIGAGWSLRRLCNIRKVEHIPNVLGSNWPDTELLLNYILWENGIKGEIIGTERNKARTLDRMIDHCRTLTAGRLYAPEYAKECERWISEAKTEALERITIWNGTDAGKS